MFILIYITYRDNIIDNTKAIEVRKRDHAEANLQGLSNEVMSRGEHNNFSGVSKEGH